METNIAEPKRTENKQPKLWHKIKIGEPASIQNLETSMDLIRLGHEELDNYGNKTSEIDRKFMIAVGVTALEIREKYVRIYPSTAFSADPLLVEKADIAVKTNSETAKELIKSFKAKKISLPEDQSRFLSLIVGQKQLLLDRPRP